MKKTWSAALVFCILAAALISGCIGTKTQPSATPEPPAVLVDYHRTGGIAGLDDRLVIFDNGAAVISGRLANREIILNRSVLDRITVVFTEAQFSMLENNYTTRRGSSDLIHYTISYHGKTVNAEDSAMPPSLQLVIDELNRILRMGEIFEPPNPFVNR